MGRKCHDHRHTSHKYLSLFLVKRRETMFVATRMREREKEKNSSVGQYRRNYFEKENCCFERNAVSFPSSTRGFARADIRKKSGGEKTKEHPDNESSRQPAWQNSLLSRFLSTFRLLFFIKFIRISLHRFYRISPNFYPIFSFKKSALTTFFY